MNEQTERAIIDRAFGPFDGIRWRKRSFYAQIVGVTRGEEKLVVKIPVPWELGRICDDAREREGAFLNDAVEEYQRALADTGIPLPAVYETTLVDGYPVHLISDTGEDCEMRVRREPALLPEILREVLAGIRGILWNGEERVGLDARLGNFGGSNGRVVYFDIFPPLIRFQGSHLVHYPNPDDPRAVRLEVTRKFMRFGILRRLRFDLMVIDPEWEAIFLESLAMFGEPMASEVLQQFSTLHDAQWQRLKHSQRSDFLRRIQPMDVDTMREIAVRVIPLRGEERRRVMEEVFVATSLAITRDPDEHAARLERYRRILAEYI